ncbi:hypothetical protein SETIT_2G111500v2 [Setaria italica]|uniref:Uncharacterized protein n=1 Tax=Setaria italica TaxID=4555 RepID=A0A368PXQ5_SETIT|nr:hypothetical protein SETIT_2G111500v2 [Setaria italica]
MEKGAEELIAGRDDLLCSSILYSPAHVIFLLQSYATAPISCPSNVLMLTKTRPQEETPPELCSKKLPCFESGSGQEFHRLLEFNALTGPPREAWQYASMSLCQHK